MRLIERDDLEYIGIDGMTYWSTLDEENRELPGPFLFCVNDTGAWLRVPNERGGATHPIHYATAELVRSAHWSRAVEIWLRDEPITRLQMLRRYESISNRLPRSPRGWLRWDEMYFWEEGSDLLWDGLSVHRFIEARVIDGARSLLWVGNGAWLRHWDRTHKEAEHGG